MFGSSCSDGEPGCGQQQQCAVQHPLSEQCDSVPAEEGALAGEHAPLAAAQPRAAHHAAEEPRDPPGEGEPSFIIHSYITHIKVIERPIIIMLIGYNTTIYKIERFRNFSKLLQLFQLIFTEKEACGSLVYVGYTVCHIEAIISHQKHHNVLC